jgi:hypothetical protein
MTLDKRLERLEKQLINEPTSLFMPDGKIVALTGPRDYLLTLCGLATPQLVRVRRGIPAYEISDSHISRWWARPVFVHCSLLRVVETTRRPSERWHLLAQMGTNHEIIVRTNCAP